MRFANQVSLLSQQVIFTWEIAAGISYSNTSQCVAVDKIQIGIQMVEILRLPNPCNTP